MKAYRVYYSLKFMRAYIVRKFFISLITVLGSVSLVFFIIHLIPGDPVENMLGEQALSVDKERIREALGLNRPCLLYTS
ncbi:MAG: hypothetical protein N3B13_03405, partial [Deltaproteobacteria bacterium]|nr:hypothetical protein [Deltaproteobacteria bacterium]